MTLPSTRAVNGFVFLACLFLLLIAFYFEFVEGLEPCPLCMAQRIVFGLIALVSLVALCHNPKAKGQLVYQILLLLVAGLGMALAGRQLWLQSLPEDLIPACGPGIYYMIEVFPFQEVITNMLMGSGDCAEVVWRDPVLSLSIPGWTFVWFLVFGLISIWQGFRSRLR